MKARSAIAVAALVACGPTESSVAPGTTSGSSGEPPSASSSSGTRDSSTVAADTTGGDAEGPCNGAVELCERTYDAVVFPGTHNSVAATQSGFAVLNANQTRPVLEQLEDGIRVLLLDVTYDGDETALCHGPCELGSRPHLEVLEELRQFLVDHPRDVVTIIYEDTARAADIEADFVAAQLVELTYVYTGGPWPTLGTMIGDGQRLVVTAENGSPPPAWLHHVWDLAWDTPYTFQSVDEFDCSLNRGSSDHGVLLMNHWVSASTGLPAMGEAATANSADVLRARAAECERVAGRLPTFVAVDFYDQGDLFAVVDELNGLP